MVERRTFNATEAAAATTPPRWVSLISSPQLLPGEDQTLYQSLIDDVFAGIKPADLIEKMLVGDVVYLVWEIWRLRRLQSNLIKVGSLEELNTFFKSALQYEQYIPEFEEKLAETLRDLLPEDQDESEVRALAHNSALNDEAADAKVAALLDTGDRDLDDILNDAKEEKAKQLVQAYARSEPKAVKQVNKILGAQGSTMDVFTNQALTDPSGDFSFLNHLGAN